MVGVLMMQNRVSCAQTYLLQSQQEPNVSNTLGKLSVAQWELQDGDVLDTQVTEKDGLKFYNW